MSLPVVLDQNMPRRAAALLRRRGFDAIHVGEIGLSTALDAEVLGEAVARCAVVVTLDADFHRILAATSAVAPSVIRIRQQGMQAEDVAGLTESLLVRFRSRLEEGVAITTDGRLARVRHLPIV